MSFRRQVIKLPHHEQQELCTTRSSYRQGRQLTAVKVYTVNDESQHLIVSGVPSLGLQDELKNLSSRFGDVTSLVFIPDYTEEKFVEAYHIRYGRIQSARFAKRQMDGRSFFGGNLHVCYAPEMESIPETRAKLLLRHHEVTKRCCVLKRSVDSVQFSEKPNPPHAPQNYLESNCIWKGIATASDPRLLPSQQLEKAAVSTYGPAVPSTIDWRECGVKETRVVASPLWRTKKHHPQEKTVHRAHLTPSQWTQNPSTHVASIPSTSSQEPKSSISPILKLIPSQVKGATKKIVFHQSKVFEESKTPATGNASLDATILAVRERIRSVGVPNVKVVLEKKLGQNINLTTVTEKKSSIL